LAALAPFSVKGYGWFFVSRPAIIKIFMDNWPMIRLWLFASRPRILFPKPEVLKYPANHIRVLDQADDPHRGQVRGSTSQTFLISSLQVFDGTCG
jgi:hypothetical protein